MDDYHDKPIVPTGCRMAAVGEVSPISPTLYQRPEVTQKRSLSSSLTKFVLNKISPVYTIPFSYGDGMDMFRFALPFTLKCLPFRHKMKTTVKTA